MRRSLQAGLAAIAVLVTGCGFLAQGPEPAGSLPSPIAKMVCAPTAQRDIGQVLGVTTTTVSPPTWVHHLYACDYEYRRGVMRLTVKELSSWPETMSYFDGLQKQLGKRKLLDGLGQGAYVTDDGSVVVRKDWKVLLVDTSTLPGSFANDRTGSGTPAETVASAILSCWAGD